MEKANNLILAGNWKLNPISLKAAKSLSTTIIKAASPVRGIDFIVCPPHIYLSELKGGYRGRKVSFGAQDLYQEISGSHTGEVSPAQLVDLGASHVILGHSERRASLESGGAGETDKVIALKIQVALKNNLTPIVCIGEPKRDPSGQHLRFIERQIKDTFAGISSKQMGELIIAYEPIWAIGGQSANSISGHDLHEMMLYIKKIATSIWGPKTAQTLTILYGGSVKPHNAYELTKNGNMAGFLVGGASLSADSFIGIAKEMQRAQKEK